jgi:hypothetical protein
MGRLTTVQVKTLPRPLESAHSHSQEPQEPQRWRGTWRQRPQLVQRWKRSSWRRQWA